SGVARARQKLAVAPRLDPHHLAAFVADDVSLAYGGGLPVLGEVAGRLALGVALAAQKPAVPAPLLDHRRAALVRRDVGLLGGGLPRSELLRLVELIAEALVEALEQLHTLETAGANLVELLLHLRREARIHDVELTAHEAVDHEFAELRGLERAALRLLD